MKNAANKALLGRRNILGSAYRLFYEDPIHLVKGQGVWLWDAEGNKYLDMYNNVPVVGHANGKIVNALTKQASLLNTHTRYLHENIVDYAEELLELFPRELERVVFTCTGSEANDLALRIAHEVTGRRGTIVTENAYHGVTSLLADMSPSLQPVATYVEVVPSPVKLMEMHGEAGVKEAFSQQIDLAAQRLAERGFPVCALLIDTVFASDGLFIPSKGVLAQAAQTIRKHGGLFIADEVQGGFARIGKYWWAFEQDEFTPDLVTLGKPMGNGHPIGGVVTKDALIREFGERCRYFNTFGGNTVSTAVGLAVLNELKNMDAPKYVEQIGQVFGAELEKLKKEFEFICAIRGGGLYWAVEFKGYKGLSPTELAADLVNQLRSNGVLIGVCGRNAEALKIRPPLILAQEHMDLFFGELRQQLQIVKG